MNDEIETGGPAFPSTGWDETGKYPGHFLGMTLRDYFAAKALEALLSKQTWNQSGPDMFARDAYTIADAMMEARKS